MADPLIGRKLGDYEILEMLGRGGMARVYKGYDSKLQRFAAVKITSVESASVDMAEVTERFFREARAIARLRHPNIVGVYQLDQFDNDQYFMAMAFIEGKDLRQILRDYSDQGRRMPADEILNIVLGIGAALDYSHSQGVIHRDVKPSNIMMDKDGTPILTDFGLVLSSWEGTLGQTFGSPHYIAPEQAVSSNKATPASDLYSLGICTYEMLVGKVPFDDPSAMSVALKQIHETPPSPRMFIPTLAPAIDYVMYKVLDKDPDRRYPSALAFYEALSHALAEDTGILPQPNRRTTGLMPRLPSVPSDSQVRREMTPMVPPPATQSYEWVEMGDDDDKTPTFPAPLDAALTPPPGRTVQRRPALLLPIGIISAAGILAVVALMLLSMSSNGAATQTATAAAIAFAGTQTAALPTTTPSPLPTTAIPPTPIPPTQTPPPPTTAAPIATNTRIAPTTTVLAAIPTHTNTVVATHTATSTATATLPTATFTPSHTPTPTLTPTPDGQVLLSFDGDQLVLINISAGNINISDLVFVRTDGGEASFPAILWDNVQAPHPPSDLPSGWCFQIIRTEAGQKRPLAGCSRLSSFRLVAPSRQFWVASEAVAFAVRRGDRILTVCPINAGQCVIKLF